jgi:hypothetical protein
MDREFFDKAIALLAVANAAWGRAAIAQTDAADRRASRCQQALQDHLSDEGWHWERFEQALLDGVNAVPSS